MGLLKGYGTVDLTIKAGEKIAISSNNGTCIVYYSTFPISPETYYEETRITNNLQEFGVFSSDKKIRLESLGNDVQYDVSVTPNIGSVTGSITITDDLSVDLNDALFKVDTTNNKVGIGITSLVSGNAKQTIVQDSTGVPVVEWVQQDNQPFVNFNSSIGASEPIEVSATETSSKYGTFKVNINGVGVKYIRLYDGPT